MVLSLYFTRNVRDKIVCENVKHGFIKVSTQKNSHGFPSLRRNFKLDLIMETTNKHICYSELISKWISMFSREVITLAFTPVTG